MQGKKYLELVDAYRASRGFQIYTLKQTIQVSFSTFRVNFVELERLLQKHSRFDPRFHGVLNRDKLQVDFIEIIRLLHNYCASVMSLVEHTRRVAREILPADALKTYQNEIDLRFKQSPLHCFLQDLRNYFLHHSNPPVAHVIRYASTESAGAGIELPNKSLLEWKNWNKASRDFILQQNNGILLEVIVTKYTANVDEFMRWLDDHIETVCKPELDELWQKHDEWADFCKSEGIPTTHAEFQEAAEKGIL
ncbi:MAG: hypothetical protein KF886_09825 [Candidatus Hydrogenedentes bacterium]|nr:hypothetical protein [Candidatus Hydrogenedentota bacterium]